MNQEYFGLKGFIFYRISFALTGEFSRFSHTLRKLFEYA